MKQRQSKKHPNGEEAVEIPGAIKKVIIAELLLVFTLPFWASLMAQGLSVF